jgi:hypothetical protein
MVGTSDVDPSWEQGPRWEEDPRREEDPSWEQDMSETSTLPEIQDTVRAVLIFKFVVTATTATRD